MKIIGGTIFFSVACLALSGNFSPVAGQALFPIYRVDRKNEESKRMGFIDENGILTIDCDYITSAILMRVSRLSF